MTTGAEVFRKRPAAHGGAYPCPCCGRLVHSELPRDYEVCPVCDWEVSPDQLRWPDLRDGPNGTASLIEAQQAFLAKVAEAGQLGAEVPGLDLPLDPGWRPIDPTVDSFEPCGVQEGPSPEDQTRLYWWRPTFWRRQGSEG